MNRNILFAVFVLAASMLSGQKYMTQVGVIHFYSEAPLENIEATNNQVSSVIDLENGEIVFSLLMSAFNFEKALMQEHFNEKYVESSKYPKAIFKGKINDFNVLNLSENASEVSISGELTMHGASNDIIVRATLKKGQREILGNAQFNISLKDYEIKIPSVVKDNISDSIEITVNMNYEALD